MEVTKRGQVNYPGNINAKGIIDSAAVTTEDLEVGKNASIINDLSVGGEAVINGNLIVKGKVINNIENHEEQPQAWNEMFKDGAIYLGDKSTWRFRVEDDEFLIEKLEDGEWEIKQSMN